MEQPPCTLPLLRSELTRRTFLKASLGALAAGYAGWAHTPAWAADAPATPGLTPDEALARLKAGNERFATGQGQVHNFIARRKDLVESQQPFACVLSCADSRVPVELIFDEGLGDLFGVRVAGNVVTTEGLASLEYAVKFLGASLIVVLGHDACGAVDATIKVERDGAELPGALHSLADLIAPAVTLAKASGDSAPSEEALLPRAIAANVSLNAQKLTQAEPILKPAVDGGKIKVIGAVYRLESGRVEWL